MEEACAGLPPRLPTTPTEAQEVPLVGTPKNSPARGRSPPTPGWLPVAPYIFKRSTNTRCFKKTSNPHVLMKILNLLTIFDRW